MIHTPNRHHATTDRSTEPCQLMAIPTSIFELPRPVRDQRMQQVGCGEFHRQHASQYRPISQGLQDEGRVDPVDAGSHRAEEVEHDEHLERVGHGGDAQPGCSRQGHGEDDRPLQRDGTFGIGEPSRVGQDGADQAPQSQRGVEDPHVQGGSCLITLHRAEGDGDDGFRRPNGIGARMQHRVETESTLPQVQQHSRGRRPCLMRGDADG
mmetsp:Transcript_23285/g.64962  ORF Transcript_23285/g.64962 Transcript_23285/m.64962 type:complete len:209 (+) Transcript_23285:2271-2897(+)